MIQTNDIVKIVERISDIRRYYYWKRVSRKRVQGKSKLSPEQISDINNLFSDFKKVSTDAHTFYTERTGNFSPKYIPDELWYAYIEPYFNPRSLAKALDTKVLYDRLLIGGGNVKHPKTIAYLINGFWISGNYEPLSVEAVAKRIMEEQCVFIKQAEDSAGGHGVVFFDKSEGVGRLNEILCSLNANTVIQTGLKQHNEMNRLNPSSVNTIRILTHLTRDEGVKIRSVIVRMGRNGSHVDNASSGGVTVGVDSTGRLKEVGYDVPGEKYYEHPDTHTRFSEVIIPNFSTILDEVTTLQWQLPQFRLLSWDIAVSEDGSPVVIEVNMHSGQLDFHQLNNGPVFGEDTRKVLSEIFGK